MYHPEIVVCNDYDSLSAYCAGFFARRAADNPLGTFGFATGSTPVGMYRALAGLYRADMFGMEFATAFNLDEYWKLPLEHPESYRVFMRETLFKHIDINPGNCHIPDTSGDDPAAACAAYDRLLEEAGGIDLQILGIGTNGHIGFNEPSDAFSAGTRLVSLTDETVKANARYFASEGDVPRQAITMGVGAITKAKEILLIASGEAKARIIKEALAGPVTPRVPASILQTRRDVVIALDKAAAALL